jgi:hypothetical protein
MRNWIVSAVVFIALSSIAQAQYTAPPATGHGFESDTVVTTAWDSVYIGNAGFEKWVEFLNDPTASMYVAVGNDTLVGKPSSHKWWTVKTGEKFFISRIKDRSFVRTRGASTTVRRRVHAGYQ